MKVLDACCGGKMFWFDKNNPLTTFCDIRQIDTVLCDNRVFRIQPDLIEDYKQLSFRNNTFDMVVFDPPHLIHAGETSWLCQKYGKLSKQYKDEFRLAFKELFRVLKSDGTLIFKWNEDQIKVSEILECSEYNPMFGHKSGKRQNTHWILFVKNESMLK